MFLLIECALLRLICWWTAHTLILKNVASGMREGKPLHAVSAMWQLWDARLRLRWFLSVFLTILRKDLLRNYIKGYGMLQINITLGLWVEILLAGTVLCVLM